MLAAIPSLRLCRAPRRARLTIVLALLALLAAACGPSTGKSTPRPTPTPQPDPTLFTSALTGDLADGTLATTVYALNARTGALLWQAGAPGSMQNQLAVSGGTLIALSQTFVKVATKYGPNYTPTGHLTAFNAKTGAKLWQVDITSIQEVELRGVTAQAILLLKIQSNGTTFTHSLVALNLADGSHLWEHDYPPDVTVWNPVLEGDTLYIMSTHGSPITGKYTFTPSALRALDGTVLWQSAQATSGSPYGVLIQGGTIYLAVNSVQSNGQLAAAMVAFSTADGSKKWTGASSTGQRDFLPIGAAGTVLYAFDTTYKYGGGITSRNLTAYNAETGAQLWQSKVGNWVFGMYQPGALHIVGIDGSALYVSTAPADPTNRDSNTTTFGGALEAHSLGTGTLLWQVSFDMNPGPPTAFAGVVYVGAYKYDNKHMGTSWAGLVEALSASDGSVTWKFQPAGGVILPPTVAVVGA